MRMTGHKNKICNHWPNTDNLGRPLARKTSLQFFLVEKNQSKAKSLKQKIPNPMGMTIIPTSF